VSAFEQLREILRDSLQLGGRADELGESTALLGNYPELDSMAVVTVIGAIEERFGIVVDDDEISAETFETVGSLCRLIERKTAG
jgi:acyl carrier protein